MKRSISAIPILLICFVLVFGADKRMTIEDSLAFKQVGGPQISPDGKWVAYTVSEWDRKENRRVSHIWMVSAEGGRSTRLTNGERGESSPQWSPDGTRIAFLANRDKGNQIWIIPAFGGEAEKLTTEENGVQSFAWSADGKTMAFVTRDDLPNKADIEKRKKEKFDTIKVDSDLTYSHLWKIDVESKEKKRLTEGEFTVSSVQWAPDGRSIAFVMSKAGVQESVWTDISEDRNTDIYLISSDGGNPVRLTTSPAADISPRWSPDGRWLAYVSNTKSDDWAAKNDLLVVAPSGGTPRNLTGSHFESVSGNIQWSPNGSSLYFSSGIGVFTDIFQVAASGGKVTRITPGNRNYGPFDIGGAAPARITFTVNDSQTPDDVWIADLNRPESAKKITWVNPEIGDFALAETNVIKWKGPDNFDIEGLLVKPLGYQAGRKYPLILMIHGGPYGRFANTFNSRAQIFAANGYAILMPNPRGSTGYGHDFTVANLGDWGGKDFRDIMSGVDSVIEKGIADPDKLVVMGGSYGGFMTFWTVSQTDRFKAAIGHAAISDWYSFHGQSDIPGLMEYGFKGQPWSVPENYRKYSPMTYVNRVKTPLMITHGERDMRVNIQQGEQYYRSLKKRGVEVIFLRYPREGHGIQEPNHVIDLVGRQLEWFDSHLGIKREKPAEAKAAASTQQNRER